MTTAPTPSRADALIREHRASMHPETLRAWASDAVDELGRLQADNERLCSSLHSMEMQALDLASENSILKRQELAELEARKPLPDIDAMRLGMEAQHTCGSQHSTGTTNWATAMTRFYERAHGIKET